MGTAGEGADSTGNPGDAKGAGWKPGKEEGSVGVAAAAGCSEAGVPSPAMEAGDPKARPGWGVAAAGDGATDGAAALGLWATKPAACRGTEVNSATPAEYRSKTCIERCTGMCTWKFFQSTQQMRRPSNSHDSLDPLGPMQIPLDHRLDRPPGPFIAFGSAIPQFLPASAFLAETAGEARVALGDLEGVDFALGFGLAPTTQGKGSECLR